MSCRLPCLSFNLYRISGLLAAIESRQLTGLQLMHKYFAYADWLKHVILPAARATPALVDCTVVTLRNAPDVDQALLDRWRRVTLFCRLRTTVPSLASSSLGVHLLGTGSEASS